MNIFKLTTIGLVSISLFGCDIAGVTKTVIKADEGRWQITLVTRIPDKEIVATSQLEYCLTAEELELLISDFRYIKSYGDCTSQSMTISEDNVRREETLSCLDAVVGEIETSIVVGQGDDVFDKIVTLKASNVGSLYNRQLRQAGLKNPPMGGDVVEIIELGARVGDCEVKNEKENSIANRALFKSSVNTGSAKSSEPLKTKLSDFLDDKASEAEPEKDKEENKSE